MKRLVIALTLSMLIGSSVVAFAANSGEVSAMFASFNLKINGQEKQLETSPLVYNGTSYLPVREMANLYGYDVTYKADSRTIELNQPTAISNPAPAPPPSTTPAQDVSINLSEWIPLRELAEKSGAKVGFNPNLKIYDDQKTYAEYQLTTNTLVGKPSDEPYYETSKDDKVNLMIYNGVSYIKITDAKSVGLLSQ